MEIKQLEYDVLVIGAGAAGLRAALAAREKGCRALVVSKRPPGRAGATPSAVLTYCAAVGADDSPAIHEADTWRWGYCLGDRELIETFAREAPATAEWLKKRGMRWDQDNGDYSLIKLAGHSRARGLHYDHMTGRELIRTLKQAISQTEIMIKPYLWVMDLLRRDERVGGAIAYDWEEGEIVVIRAGAVVLACGGGQQLFSFNTAPRDLCGDGFALAYRAGAKLVDMEFVQMYPTVIIWPSAARGVPLTSGELLREGAELVNVNDQEFLSNYTATALGDTTRDLLSTAIAKEVTAGRGTPHGGVYLKLGKAPDSLVEKEHFRYLRKLGVDLKTAKVEVAPGAHFWLGGVAVDSNGATNLPGLYAAGEAAGGLHGANRLAGNALTETMVFGARAGAAAALFVKERGVPEKTPVESPCLEFLGKTRQGKRDPNYFRAELQLTIQEGCGVLRRGDAIRRTLRDLDDLSREIAATLSLSFFPAKYDNNLTLSIELFQLLETGRLLAAAALMRQESRGAHQRTDFPDQNLLGAASQYLEKGISGPIHSFGIREASGADVVLHLRSGDLKETYQLYGARGKTVMEALGPLSGPAGKVLRYTEHNCKRGLCGHCRMRINGRMELACLRIITEPEITVERFEKE